MRRTYVSVVLGVLLPLALAALAGGPWMNHPEPGVNEGLPVTAESVPVAPPVVIVPVEEEPLPALGRDMWWLLGLSATAAIALLAAHVWSRERNVEVEVEGEVTFVGAE